MENICVKEIVWIGMTIGLVKDDMFNFWVNCSFKNPDGDIKKPTFKTHHTLILFSALHQIWRAHSQLFDSISHIQVTWKQYWITYISYNSWVS